MNSAEKLLNDLLDRHERNPERRRDLTTRIYNEGLLYEERRILYDTLKNAEATGCISLELGKHDLAHNIQRVRVKDLGKLYQFLNREPLPQAAEKAGKALRERFTDAPEWIRAIIDDMELGWAHQRQVYRLSLDDREEAKVFLRILHAIEQGGFENLDMRTFSRRVSGDSKAIENHAPRLAEALRKKHDLPWTSDVFETLAALGLQKFPQPILIAGRFELSGQPITADPYLGIPADWIEQINIVGNPRYVLVIENFSSFNRHAREIRGKDDVVIFSSGYSSRPFRKFLTHLDVQLPPYIPFFHWGDIDIHGIRIFRNLEKFLKRPLKPHLMTPEIARRRGRLQLIEKPELIDAKSSLFRLSSFFQQEGYYTLEQEDLDPLSPILQVA